MMDSYGKDQQMMSQVTSCLRTLSLDTFLVDITLQICSHLKEVKLWKLGKELQMEEWETKFAMMTSTMQAATLMEVIAAWPILTAEKIVLNVCVLIMVSSHPLDILKHIPLTLTSIGSFKFPVDNWLKSVLCTFLSAILMELGLGKMLLFIFKLLELHRILK